MTSKKSEVHHPTSAESDPSADGSQTKAQARTPAEIQKPEGEPKQEVKEDDHISDADNGSHGSSHDSEADPDLDADPDADPEKKSPEPTSCPCTCRCGGCCSHSTSSEPQHCVRCHTDYTFNHSQACSVPHVFYTYDIQDGEPCYRDIEVRSICCGDDVRGTRNIKSSWEQPFPCFMGWHTTDVGAVKDQYNGLNVLRCHLGRNGKCRRTKMKHHAHYDHLFDDEVKYVDEDQGDREAYLKRKRGDFGDKMFDRKFSYVEDYELIGKKKRWDDLF